MQGKILFIGDCQADMAVLVEMLEDDFELQTISSSENIIENILVFCPHIVIMDMSMTGLDVYEACRKIKESPVGPFTQVIMVSERTSPRQRLLGYEVGADDYLLEPFNRDDLMAKVNIHLRLHKSMADIWTPDSKIVEFNEELQHIVNDRSTEVPATRDIAVFALAKLAESRDPETGAHLKRVSGYCRILAEELSKEGPYSEQIDFQYIADIYHSSPLHDIGKIGIPDAVLLKPGRLTAEEFKIMQRHSIIGAEVLERAIKRGSCGRFFGMAADIARSHHERFNGSGYPHGLCGTDIPLSARIVGLADVFDALTSKRVYKPAFSIEVAKRMIEDESGAHFDPVIVAAFQRRFADFARICEAKQHRELEMAGALDCDDVRR